MPAVFFLVLNVFHLQTPTLRGKLLQALARELHDIQTKIKALQRDRGIKDNGIKKKV